MHSAKFGKNPILGRADLTIVRTKTVSLRAPAHTRRRRVFADLRSIHRNGFGKPTDPANKCKPGSLDALRAEYIASTDFNKLANSTKRETLYVLDALCLMPNKSGGRNGECNIKTLQRKVILGWRDKLKDKPGAANKMIRVVKLLLSFAVERDYRPDNPALKIKMLEAGQFRDWTDAELMQFEKRWPLGTTERTGYALALYTGQRRADVAAMKWSDIAGDVIVMTQHKTGTEMAIPIHPNLAKALRKIHPRRGETIITGAKGHPLNPIYFGKLMADAISKAGLPDDCVLHGLRFSTARILEELGHKPRALTGHISPQMERKYSRRASQKRNATAAILSWVERDKSNATAARKGRAEVRGTKRESDTHGKTK